VTRPSLGLLVLVLALASAGRALATAPPEPAVPADVTRVPCEPLAPGATLTVDLADAPLTDVARVVSCALERNIAFAPGELGARRVTVISRRPVDRRGLVALWHTLLAEHGLVAERRGAYEFVRPATSR